MWYRSLQAFCLFISGLVVLGAGGCSKSKPVSERNTDIKDIASTSGGVQNATNQPSDTNSPTDAAKKSDLEGTSGAVTLEGSVRTSSDEDSPGQAIAYADVRIREVSPLPTKTNAPRANTGFLGSVKTHADGTFLLNLQSGKDYLITIANDGARRLVPETFPQFTLPVAGGSFNIPPIVLLDTLNPNPFMTIDSVRKRLAHASEQLSFLKGTVTDDRGIIAGIKVWLTDLDRVLNTPRTILIPAYAYPAPGVGIELWNSVVDAAKKYRGKLKFILIVNPASGPPPNGKMDTNYEQVLRQCESEPGIRLIGYLPVSNKANNEWKLRPSEDLKHDIKDWTTVASSFKISGLGLGCLPEDSDNNIEMLKDALSHFQSNSRLGPSFFMGNPGVSQSVQGWITKGNLLNNLCIFESNKGFDKFLIPKWVFDNNSTEKISVLPYNFQDSQLAIRRVRGLLMNGCTTLYITDASDSEPNGGAWRRLPKYWDALLEAAAAP